MRRSAEAKRAGAQGQAQGEYRAMLSERAERIQELREQREQARSEHRWLRWLTRAVAIFLVKDGTPPPPPPPRYAPSREEVKLNAGIEGERLVAEDLGTVLDDDWVLFRGYKNRAGEIDHLLLGPQALIAIESKHRNATVSFAGDRWWFEKHDRYGNLVDHGPFTDRAGRSPSQQLNEPVNELERFLRSRGQPVSVRRVILLTHHRSRFGRREDPKVDLVETSAYSVPDAFIYGAEVAFESAQLAELARLIERDHRHHEQRRARARKRTSGR
jgi:hypothetical protein